MPAYTTDSGESAGRRQTLATLVLVLVSLGLLSLPVTEQQRIASALRSSVLLPFVSTQGALQRARGRATDSEELRQEVDSLVALLTSQRTLAEENRRLRGLLELRARLGAGYAPATALRARTVGSESMFLLDVGAAHGVDVYAPVLTREGLVGVVREVREQSAVGMDWTHPDFRASAMDAFGLTYGMVESRRGEFREQDRLVYDGTAFHTDLADGTVVVSSGFGDVFPRGVPIGAIDGLAEADAGWRKSYWLLPMVEPAGVTHVLVGTQERTSTDLAAAWPADSTLTEKEVVLRELTREERLQALADTVRELRELLHTPPALRDSLLRELPRGGAQSSTDSMASGGGPPPIPDQSPGRGPLSQQGGEAPPW